MFLTFIAYLKHTTIVIHQNYALTALTTLANLANTFNINAHPCTLTLLCNSSCYVCVTVDVQDDSG